MAHQSTESKRLLSYTIAEWACGLKYEDLSLEAIQAAKLFWFDSIGCALGGSQQEDAKILLKHYRAMSGNDERNSRDSSTPLGTTNKRDRAMSSETVAGVADPGPASTMPATKIRLRQFTNRSKRCLDFLRCVDYVARQARI